MKSNQLFSNKITVALFAILCCLLWGSAFPAVKTGYILFNIPANNTWLKLIFAGYRFLIAGLLILAFCLISKQKITIKAKNIKHIMLLGLISTTLQYFFFYIGLSHTTGVKGSILTSMGIFFTAIIAHFLFTNDKINRNRVIGLLLGFAGVIAANFSFELLKPDFTLLGDGLIIASQITSAISAIYVKKISSQISVVLLTAYQLIFGALLLIVPAVFKTGIFPFQLSPGKTALYLYLALLSAVAFALWNVIIKYNQVGKVTIYQFLIPVFGVTLSSIFLSGEKITVSVVMALVLVSLGIVTVNLRKKVKQEHIARELREGN